MGPQNKFGRYRIFGSRRQWNGTEHIKKQKWDHAYLGSIINAKGMCQDKIENRTVLRKISTKTLHGLPWIGSISMNK